MLNVVDNNYFTLLKNSINDIFCFIVGGLNRSLIANSMIISIIHITLPVSMRLVRSERNPTLVELAML